MEIKTDFYQGVLKSTFFLVGSFIVSKICTLVFIAFAARLLGVGSFGVYALILSFIAIFTAISDFGLHSLTVRDVARDKSISSKYLSSNIFIKIFSCLIAYYGLYIFTAFFDYSNEIKTLVLIAGLSLVADSFRNSLNSFFYIYERVDILSLLNVLSSFLKAILGISALVLGYGVKGLFIQLVFVSWLIFIISLYIVIKKFTKPALNIDLSFLGKVVKKAFPFALLSIMSMVYFRIDTVLLSLFKGQEAVGYYTAPYKLIEILMFIPISFIGVLFPSASYFSVTSQEKFFQSYEWSVKLLIVIIIPIAVGATLLSDPIVRFILGEEFIRSSTVIVILIWAVVVIFFNAPAGNIIYNSELLSGFIIFAGFNTLLNIVLNVIFIPRFSFLGSASVTLTTEISGCIINLYFLKKILHKLPNFKSIFFKPLMASILMGAFVFISKGFITNIFILTFLIIVSAFLYIWIVLKLGILSSQEKEAIKNVFLKTKRTQLE